MLTAMSLLASTRVQNPDIDDLQKTWLVHLVSVSETKDMRLGTWKPTMPLLFNGWSMSPFLSILTVAARLELQ